VARLGKPSLLALNIQYPLHPRYRQTRRWGASATLASSQGVLKPGGAKRGLFGGWGSVAYSTVGMPTPSQAIHGRLKHGEIISVMKIETADSPSAKSLSKGTIFRVMVNQHLLG
jgi:hypothetical protein